MGRHEKNKRGYEDREVILVVEGPREEEQIIAEGKIFGVIAYLSILCLVPIVYFSTLRMIPTMSKKVNKFAIFHARQGFVIFLLEVAVVFVNIIPAVGQLIFAAGSLVLSFLSLMGIVQVLRGNYWKCPIISDWAEKFRI